MKQSRLSSEFLILHLILLLFAPLAYCAEPQWTTPVDLNGISINSSPVAIARSGGRLDVFYRGGNSHLWTSSRENGSWVTADLGAEIRSAPAAVSRDQERLDLFYQGANNHLWTLSWNAGGWTPAVDLGGVTLTSAPAAVARNANRIDLFYRGQNNHLWSSYWDGGPWWSAPIDLGGVALTSDPAAVSRSKDRIDVFYGGPNGHLWTTTWDQNSGWSTAADLGGAQLTSAPSAVSRAPGRIDVFYRGPNNHLWASYWDGGPWWSAPIDVGLELNSQPAAVALSGARLEVFYQGSGNHLWASAWDTSQQADVTSPPFNYVWATATHNSYWVNRVSGEAQATGTEERLVDQLLFDRTRAIEIDIHPDGANAGRFTVYHTSHTVNSFCSDLDECLKQLQIFHYANPDHDPMVIVLEFKDITSRVFDRTHTVTDLDTILERQLGVNLFRPRDFLAYCAQKLGSPAAAGRTMRECSKNAGWPSLAALRGKFLVPR